MDVILYLNGLAQSLLGPYGSPLWYIVGACVVTVFLARWATAIRRLLPFLGAFTLIGLGLWVLTGLGVISWHL